MNRTYALVWNPSLAAWTVTDERARRRAKGAGAVLAAALLLPLTAIAADLPSGGQVVSGSGAINQPNANQMVIDQASNKLAIDWQSFDIAAGNKVTFNQPGRDAIALNRVLGADGSKIMGQLDANGRVFLINPNGVLFGSGAQVNVGGLVASTLNISNSDFAAGNYKFKGNGSNASVINNGQITAADGGSVALLGGTVSNNGVIVANQGSVALAAGNAVTLDFAGDGLLNVQVDEAVVDALVENHQLIKADGGQVLLTANAGDALLKTVVNNTGVIEAQTLGEKDGKIVLLGSFDGGTVQVAGTLDASAPNGGDGGFIETSGAHVKVADSTKVTTKAANGKTGTWLIDPTDFTVSAGNDNQSSSGIGANTLSSNLASNSVTLQTVATGSEAGDINVNAAVTWNADTTLTLNAHNNININAAITASDAQGKVALQYGQASANGGTADYHIAAPINLQSGENFSTQKGSTGSVHSYTVVNDAAALQAMNNHLGGNYAVGSHIDLSGISNWQPVGSVTFFTGRFDGLGHTLSNLTIDRSGVLDPVGLFGYTSSSVIRDIGLVGGSVTGGTYVGGLVGYNLVGYNQIGAISNAYATGSVSGVDYVGGLVGYNYGGAISNAYATGSVSGSGDYVGGLVGVNTNSGTISNAYATGSVLGASQVGGLVGSNDGSISSSFYATTNAAGNPINNNGDTVAGFDGNAYGTGKTWAELTQASTFTGWSIATTGGSNAIWRIYDGYSGPLLRSFLKSVTVTVNDVAGKTYDSNTGWVAGASYSSSDNSANLLGSASYTNVATRNAGTYALGLTGLYSNQEGYDITVAAGSYTIAKATISAVTDISASNKTYDATTAANLSYDDAGFTGRIDGDALTVASASGAFTDKNAGTGKAVDITGIVLGGADAANYTLTSNTATTTADISKADLAVSGISAANKTYDASTATTLTGTASINALGSDVVFVSGTSVGAFADKNAGNDKAITVTGYTLSGTDANNYNLLQPSGVTATINKADLALSGSKVYDGSTSVAGSTLTATGVAGETFAVAGSGDASNLASKNVQSGAALASITGLSLGSSSNGGLASNYNAPGVAGSSYTVTAKGLTLTGISAVDKIYDATTTAALNTANMGYSGLVSGDTVTLAGNGTGSFANKNAGANKAVTVSGYSLSGTDAGNYVVTQPTGLTASISKADLAVTGISALNKTYDATTAATLSGSAAVTAISGDTVSLSDTGVGTFADKNAGGNKAVTVTGYTLSGNDADNYNIVQPTGLTATISKAALTVKANNASKTYDGLTFSGGNGVSYSDFVNGENASVLGGALVYGGTSQDAKNAGTYSLNASGLNADNYTISYTDGNLTIDKAQATVTANSGQVIYNGQQQSVSGFTASGLVNDETTSVLSGVSTSGGSGTNAGSYSHSASGSDDNYNLTFVDGSLTIDKAQATVTANSGQMVYNGQQQSIAGFTANGLVNGETTSVLSGVSTSGGSGTNAGSYSHSASGSDDNYNLTFVDGSLTIDKAQATVTANSGQMVYNGQQQSIAGFTASGLVNGETTSVLSGVSTSGGSGTNAGSYSHSASGSDENYDLTFVDGNLTINKAALTVTANNASKTYNGLAFSGGNGVSYSGFVNGEGAAVLGGTLTYGGSSQGTINAGTYGLNVSGLTASNYDISYNAGSLNVAKAQATVTANSGQMTYNGQQQSITGFTASGLVNGETASVLSGVSTSGGSGTNAGSYSHSASGTDGNYELTFADGSLTIDKAQATVTANSGQVIYNGQQQSVSGFTASGLVNGETASVLSGVSTSGGNGSNAGGYIHSATGTDGNYDLSFIDGALTIDKADLTITANDASKIAGQSIALTGYSASGLLGDDSISSVSLSSLGQPTTAAAGNYAIVASDALGAALSNYDIDYQNGTLLVSAAPITPTTPSNQQPTANTPTYISVLASNGQSLSTQAPQQARQETVSEPEAQNLQMLMTNPLAEVINLQVINQGIRLPEGI